METGIFLIDGEYVAKEFELSEKNNLICYLKSRDKEFIPDEQKEEIILDNNVKIEWQRWFENEKPDLATFWYDEVKIFEVKFYEDKIDAFARELNKYNKVSEKVLDKEVIKALKAERDRLRRIAEERKNCYLDLEKIKDNTEKQLNEIHSSFMDSVNELKGKHQSIYWKA